MRGYNDKLEADRQISAEEKIACLIRAKLEESEGSPSMPLTDEDCADLGHEILKATLREFRPDLFE
jgi:hypothetical protein